MIVSLHPSDIVPSEVAHLNARGTALDMFEWYVNQENSGEYQQFTVNRDAFLAGWSSWTDEMQSGQFLLSTTIVYRIKHVMGSLCTHLCRQQTVVAEKEVDYFTDPWVRFRRGFIAEYSTFYFAMYFCWSHYNLAMRTLPAQSQRPGIEKLRTLLESYRTDPELARNVISDLHSFVMLRLVP